MSVQQPLINASTVSTISVQWLDLLRQNGLSSVLVRKLRFSVQFSARPFQHYVGLKVFKTRIPLHNGSFYL